MPGDGDNEPMSADARSAARRIPQVARAPDIMRDWIGPVVAEAVGAFTLTFAAVCAIATTNNNIIANALASGLAIRVMTACATDISGAVYNPALCIGFVIARKITIPKAIAYALAELAGAARRRSW